MKNFIFCTVMISFYLLLPSSSSGKNKIMEIKTRRQTTKTAQKMKFSIKDFFSKCDQIRCKRKKAEIWRNP